MVFYARIFGWGSFCKDFPASHAEGWKSINDNYEDLLREKSVCVFALARVVNDGGIFYNQAALC